MGGRHHSSVSTVRSPPPRARAGGWGLTLQYSSHFTGVKCQEIQADTSAAPSSIQMQPVCVLNSCTSSHLRAFTHAVPSAGRLLSAPHVSGVTSSQRPPLTACSLILRLSGSPSEHLPRLSCAHLSIYLPVVTGLTWMGDSVCLGTAGRIPGPW